MIDKIVIDLFYGGYQIFIPALLMLYWLCKRKRLLWEKLMVTCNILLLTNCAITGMTWLITFCQSFLTNTDAVFKQRILGPYWYTYVLMLAGNLLLPHLLWMRRFRWNKKVAAMIWAGISLGTLTEKTIIYWASIYRDTLASRWTYFTPDYGNLILSILVYGLALTVGYFVLNKYSKILIKEARKVNVRTSSM